MTRWRSHWGSLQTGRFLSADNWYEYWQGGIDAVNVYQGVLSDAGIQTLANS